jgi:predicted nuclease of restriction endonuclease-like (RecB) superfamily
VSTLATQLSWSHFIELLPLQTPDAKLFYAQEVVNQGFGIRELRKHIEQKDYTLLIEAKERLESRKLLSNT